MKNLCLAVASFGLIMQAVAAPLAFPTAEGFGRYAQGARGVTNPEVYHVTNLNDSGTGSFRDAVSKEGRIIVFDVSGVIKLSSTLVFKGNTVIAGQTAPGDGVVLYGDRVSFSGAHNLIIRYLRIRMGVGGSSGKDAAGIANGRNMIFDHLSVSWGRDETFSISWDNKGTNPSDITIQNSIIGQGLQTHSCGGLIQTEGGVTLFRNLYIDNKTRNPKVKGLNQFVNNVVYNWGSGGGYIQGDSGGDSWADVEDNYFIQGPSTGSTAAFVRGTETFQIYQKGNSLDYNKNGALDGSLAEVGADGTFFGSTPIASKSSFTGIPKAHPDILQQTSAEEAYDIVVKSVGASYPVRDEVDAYMVAELMSLGSKGLLISNENENGIPNNVGNFAPGALPKDSDNDGIPDEWEDKLGLNKNDNADATQIDAATGYLNIELYLNGLVDGFEGSAEPIVRAPEIQKQGGGSSKQEIKIGEPIVDFAYGYFYADDLEITGLPAGVIAVRNAEKSRYEISGTPTEIGIFNFSVRTIGGAEGTESASKSGTITVLDAEGKLPEEEVETPTEEPIPPEIQDDDGKTKISGQSVQNTNKFLYSIRENKIISNREGLAEIVIFDMSGSRIYKTRQMLYHGENTLQLKQLKNTHYLVKVHMIK